MYAPRISAILFCINRIKALLLHRFFYEYMAVNRFKGLGVALITPFRSDNSIDIEALDRLVEYQIKGGVDFLCIMGTTAETPTLTTEEKQMLKNHLVERVAGRVPLLMGCGGNSTAAVVNELQSFDWKGIDGILSVCPYYNKPSQEGLYQHYRALAQASPLPIVLYNVPGRTGVNMTAETCLRLAQIPNIVAIKEASGNREQIEAILAGAPEGFQVLSGNDDDTLWMMKQGGAGIISVASNVAPGLMSEFTGAIRQGDMAKAEALNEKLTPLFNNCFVESNPIPAKAAMHAMGLIENEFRLPLVPCQQSTYDLMVETIKPLGL